MTTTQKIMINPNLQPFKLTSEMVDSIVQPWRKLVAEIEAERDIARLERDEAIAECKSLWSLVNENKLRAYKAERERDEAREALSAAKHYLTKERDDALSQIVQAECRAERFCQERDELREEVDRYREKLDLSPIHSEV